MPDCCGGAPEVGAQDESQRRVLRTALGINAVMFCVLMVAAFWGRTVALFADGFDNFGDALTYGISLWAVGKSPRQKAKVSFLKGSLILFAACAIAVNIAHKLVSPEVPSYRVMGVFSALAFAANLACLLLLSKHRSDDINMESVWHCSRNDIVVNVSVFLSAGLVWAFHSWWPDVIVAAGLAVLLFRSAFKILFKSRRAFGN